MRKLFMFAETDTSVREVRVDPANIDRQKRDLEALGYHVSIIDEDERIRYGLLAQKLKRGD
ncbi:hypothetical protein O7626_30725 [Micromonospora sp. WMMD1102]|uniref:hypothetical protein n=1 Tax=Micromonospora sp. WMMD1102 TaxID=3016105 RepID=UPI0024155B10|nr:hypothetical protein [Micromonospora sp. WMMD1102]MDG4790247.1 hypothetical protein [Micromonospora sp. WMMD1102]